ncbi:MAG: sulfite exporter TauE/SafE family protein, partial [Pseudomonadota bacterium]
MDFTLYWFMFPVAIGVATCAMLSGIGGAALFTPIFILVFPLLGPAYPLDSTVAAIGTALLTETFGFLSGFVGYRRQRLIDGALVRRYLRISVPVAIAGAFLAQLVADSLLIAVYAALVFGLAIVHVAVSPGAAPAAGVDAQPGSATVQRRLDRAGREYAYRIPRLGARG